MGRKKEFGCDHRCSDGDSDFCIPGSGEKKNRGFQSPDAAGKENRKRAAGRIEAAGSEASKRGKKEEKRK